MRTLSGTLALAGLAGCCFGASPQPDTAPDPPSLERDGLFLVARPRPVDASAPARLTAPIPTTLATSPWPPDGPPRAQIRARLCAGDAGEIDRWIAAASGATGATEDAVAFAYADLAEFCAGPLCRALRSRIGAVPAGAGSGTLLLALARCGDGEDAASLLEGGAPPRATLAWVSAHEFALPLTGDEAHRALEAVEGYLRRDLPSPLDRNACEPVLSAAPELVRAGAGAALLALHARLDGAAADCLTWSFGRVVGPRFQDAFVAACPRLVHARCDAHRPPAEEAPAASPDVRALEGAAREAELDRLRTCAAGEDLTARDCLMDLAVVDRASATVLARGWVDRDPDGELSGIARALIGFASDEALRSYLGELQLLPVDAALARPAITPLQALVAGERLAWFDSETDDFPNHHDALLVELAALAPDVLEGVLFDETPPGEVHEGGEVPEIVVDEGIPYVLHAYDGGAAWQLDARNLGDWYDLDAVIGLLNALAAQRGSSVRWLALSSRDQTAYVVAGPRSSLERAVEDGWLEPAEVGASAAARDHERELLERLIGTGALE
jgi:hypothetical protein